MAHPKYKNIGAPADRIIEELGEALQAVIKGKRFGWDNTHPDKPEITNLQQLSLEIDDIFEAFKDLQNSLKEKDNDI